jgi:dTDP-4-amino-4,6-dideoxygalactose transaminase
VVHYEHLELGYNLRMSNLTAAVALAQLSSLEERVKRRREIYQEYRRRLGDLPGVAFMPEAAWNEATRWLTVMRVDSRVAGVDPEAIRLALEEENIESRPVWKPLHLQPVFRGIRFFGDGTSDHMYEEGLCLPSGSALTEADVERIAGIVAKTVAG